MREVTINAKIPGNPVRLPDSQIDYSWDFLKRLQIGTVSHVYDWESVKNLIHKSEEAIKPYIEECHNLDLLWEALLEPLCGNQNAIDWNNFRPLRQSREEDWSDWLAWLLETSQTTTLADSLFAEHMQCQTEQFISPKVKRETPLDGRRADVVISWGKTRKTHIEVKIWDKNFDKTFETAIKLHKNEPNVDWNDFILIPSQSQNAWNEVAQKYSSDQTVRVTPILWNDVVRGLRRCLWAQRESVFWRAWAWVFCSVIENKLLGLEPIDHKRVKIQMVLLRLSVLKLDPEKEYG